ncbi:hypothetical protein STEG23_005690 [Scotinomys teguina]
MLTRLTSVVRVEAASSVVSTGGGCQRERRRGGRCAGWSAVRAGQVLGGYYRVMGATAEITLMFVPGAVSYAPGRTSALESNQNVSSELVLSRMPLLCYQGLKSSEASSPCAEDRAWANSKSLVYLSLWILVTQAVSGSYCVEQAGPQLTEIHLPLLPKPEFQEDDGCLWKPEEGVGSPGSRVIAVMSCHELNLGPLDQSAFLFVVIGFLHQRILSYPA